eukprot:Pgem_evm1s13752
MLELNSEEGKYEVLNLLLQRINLWRDDLASKKFIVNLLLTNKKVKTLVLRNIQVLSQAINEKRQTSDSFLYMLAKNDFEFKTKAASNFKDGVPSKRVLLRKTVNGKNDFC